MTLIASTQLTIVLGLGVTGLSVARFLSRQKTKFMVIDSRANPPGLDEFCSEFPNVSYAVGELDSELLSLASEVVVSPGIDLKTPEIATLINAGVSVIGDIELFAREVDKPIVAITGSNAKTTVTSLVGQMAIDDGVHVAIGGNIGTPVLDLLLENADLYVLELSSFQLESTFSLNATVSTVLNISEDHMDRYDSLGAYHRAKQRIYFGAQTVVVNRADPLTQPPLAQGVNRISFGLSQPDIAAFGVVTRNGIDHLAHEFKSLMPVSELQLRGSHNVANCLAALAIGHAVGLSLEAMLQTLKNFKGLAHRCQWLTTIDGVDYINDSKATNVGATVAAIDGFADELKGTSKRIVLIAGGESKGADFAPLTKSFIGNVSTVVLIGVDAQRINDAIIAENMSDRLNVTYANSLRDAICLAKDNAKQNDIVLLSPACASFDMFKGFEDRGDQFIGVVKELAV